MELVFFLTVSVFPPELLNKNLVYSPKQGHNGIKKNAKLEIDCSYQDKSWNVLGYFLQPQVLNILVLAQFHNYNEENTTYIEKKNGK